MYSRTVTCTVDPSKVDEFRTALNQTFLPRIQGQEGFVDNIESLDPATGEFNCMTLWKSKADVDAYDRGLFQEIASALGSVMVDGPTVKTLPVENSSVHHVATGKAA
jgi:heme-degrading monooxygenase HmoA